MTTNIYILYCIRYNLHKMCLKSKYDEILKNQKTFLKRWKCYIVGHV